MERKKLLIEKLKQYSETDSYPFHMPGHKRRIEAGCLREWQNPYGIDITEIDGFDNLHHPEGILKESMEWAAEVYGSDRTYYLVNGSSCGILSAVSAAVSFGGRILMGRNCHKSAYHGVILNHLKSAYIYPQIIERLGIQGGISTDDVEKMLEKYPDTEAVLIVSPTYDGIVSNIRDIAAAVHKKGIPLIVDEAHGAHFSFAGKKGNGGQEGKKGFPVSALDCGADLVIQSLHKTLPSLTQTAVLHVKERYINIKRLEHYLQIYQSSSPSYVFMAGIEKCIFEMHEHGEEWYCGFEERLWDLRNALGGLCRLKLLDESVIGRDGVFDLDRSKLVISCRDCVRETREGAIRPFGGADLAEWLRREYHLEMEMFGADYIVAITTFIDTRSGLSRLKEALLEIDSQLYKITEKTCEITEKVCENAERASGSTEKVCESAERIGGSTEKVCESAERAGGSTEKVCESAERTGRTAGKMCGKAEYGGNGDCFFEAEVCMTISEAEEAKRERVLIDHCAGRVSLEFVYLYPPGIPILAPGERITEKIVGLILSYRSMGLPVQGMEDEKAEYLQVLLQ